ncbi:MAG: PEP-CTERM sorting domain-containing protein [Verrucomicrobia bacterium]|nr:MAG: PEP-CTERM sorting domain-containing protein [Verrucomicrobiota bacterium]
MKTGISCLYTVLLLSGLTVHGQGTFIFDQESADENVSGPAGDIEAFQPIGQSFVPGLNSIGFVRLNLRDLNPANSLGATVIVNLRSGSITGSVVGSTDPVFMADGFNGYPDFFFSTPVSLTPGTTYFLQPQVQSGDSWGVVAYHFAYPNGTLFVGGAADVNNDLWFREGRYIPEPSSVGLILIGLGGLAWRRRKFGADDRQRKLQNQR